MATQVPPSLRKTDGDGRQRRVRFGVADARPMSCPWGPSSPMAAMMRDGGGDERPPEAPKASTAFAGAGRTLGGGAGAGAGADAAAAAGATPASTSDAALPDVPVVDDAKPTATVQLRLLGGKRVTAKLNLDHTVGHLRAVVRAQGAADRPYVLLAGFPPKPLADTSATIEAAGLKGAAVSQKLA